MAQTRRAQILMEPEEYEHLEHLAQQEGSSVAELIRTAVREKYLTDRQERIRAVEEICRMNLPFSDWESLDDEVAAAHGDGLP